MKPEDTISAAPNAQTKHRGHDWLSSVREISSSEVSAKLVGLNETDARIRSLKLMRSTLARRLKEEGCRVIGITSPLPNVGKSFIASNLAASMSRISSNLLILADLDLQRPSVTEYFPLEPSNGVIEYLRSEASSMTEIAQRIEGLDLAILPTFQRDCVSAELLASERFDDFMSKVRALSEEAIVFCDMPPLLVNDDALLITTKLDGVIFVVEQSVTTQKQLEAAVDLVQPTKIIGTVMNRYSGPVGDDYGRYSSYEYY